MSLISRFGIVRTTAAAVVVLVVAGVLSIVLALPGHGSSHTSAAPTVDGSTAIVNAIKGIMPQVDKDLAAAQTHKVTTQQPVVVAVATTAHIVSTNPTNPYKVVTGTRHSTVPTGITMHFGDHKVYEITVNGAVHKFQLKANQAIIIWTANKATNKVLMTFHVAHHGFDGTITLAGTPGFDFYVGGTVHLVVHTKSIMLVMDHMADPATFAR